MGHVPPCKKKKEEERGKEKGKKDRERERLFEFFEVFGGLDSEISVCKTLRKPAFLLLILKFDYFTYQRNPCGDRHRLDSFILENRKEKIQSNILIKY